MIDRHLIFEIHRLADEGRSIRKIARTVGLSRDSVAKYLKNPLPKKACLSRGSKLDPFKEEMARLLDIDPQVSAAVIMQRLANKGYAGGLSIIKDYLRNVRPKKQSRQAYLRFESAPGQQCQIDWGHFGSLTYGQVKRPLFALAVIEAYSRLMYVWFAHSQKQEVLHAGLLKAFEFFGGTPEELVHDNMLTAVTQRVGPIIRYNEAFLEFLRPFKIKPQACHPGKPHEKGKVEKGAIHYIRHNFWPLRSFADLGDVQAQVENWLKQVANVRQHATTGQRPVDRFDPTKMRPLPEMRPDGFETNAVKVHSDFSIRFDGNMYTVPPWAVSRSVVVKADHHTVLIYYQDALVATHRRSWEKKQRLESSAHREAARSQLRRHWYSQEVAAFISLGEEAKIYLEHLADSGQGLKNAVGKIMALKDAYGKEALLAAMARATAHQAYGSEYIQNILEQGLNPPRNLPPVRLSRDNLNHIRLAEPCLAEYDALVLQRRNEHA